MIYKIPTNYDYSPVPRFYDLPDKIFYIMMIKTSSFLEHVFVTVCLS